MSEGKKELIKSFISDGMTTIEANEFYEYNYKKML
jgi:hypothetical protein